jgi:hypothetical protein
MRVAGGHIHIHQGFEYNNVFHSVISLENPAFTKLLIGHELFASPGLIRVKLIRTVVPYVRITATKTRVPGIVNISQYFG